MTVQKIEREMLRGVAPMAVMSLLAQQPMYGYEIGKALANNGGEALALGQGTLYPLLYNLEAKKLVQARDTKAPSGKKRRYYSLTSEGRRHLAKQKDQWHAVRSAVDSLMNADGNPA